MKGSYIVPAQSMPCVTIRVVIGRRVIDRLSWKQIYPVIQLGNLNCRINSQGTHFTVKDKAYSRGKVWAFISNFNSDEEDYLKLTESLFQDLQIFPMYICNYFSSRHCRPFSLSDWLLSFIVSCLITALSSSSSSLSSLLRNELIIEIELLEILYCGECAISVKLSLSQQTLLTL